MDLKISQLTALSSSPSASDLLAIVNGGSTKKITYQNLMTVPDDIFTLADNSDTTKKVMFQLSSLNTATTRTLTAQDKSGLIAVQAAALTASRALISDASGFVSFSAATATEVGYLAGVTSAIQTQFTGKIAKGGDSGVTTFTFLSGNGIDTDLTAGSDVLNIGAANANIINIGRAGATVNIIGSLQYSNVTNLEVVDALILLNKGGGAASATAAGFEIEESGAVSGYFKTISSRDGYILKAPSIAYAATFSLASLSAARTFTLPDATGTIALTSDIPTAISGTYTPTLTNTANVDSSSAFVCQYLRVGSVVTVSGKININATAAGTDTQIGVSLPIASNFGTFEDCGGVGFNDTVQYEGFAILADSTNNRAQIRYNNISTANTSFFFTFTYQII